MGLHVVCRVCDAPGVAAYVVVAAAAAAAAVAGPLAGLRFEAAKELVRVCLLSTCADALHVMSDGDVEMVRN